MRTRVKRFGYLCCLALVFAMTACAGQNGPPLAEPSPGLSGLWQGQVTDNIGSAEAELTLLRSDDAISGEVVLTFSVGPVRRSVRGEVRGQVEDASIRLELIPEDDDYCPYRAVATQTGNSLTGSYRGVGCVEEIEGELRLEKQP